MRGAGLSASSSLHQAWLEQSAQAIALDLSSSEAARHPEEPRFAFDCDQTLIRGDLGEATYRRALAHRWIISHDAWWRHLDVGEIGSAPERAAWRVAYERESQARSLSGGYAEGLPRVDTLSAELWSAYETLCRVDVRSGYIYAARSVYQRLDVEVATLALTALADDPAVEERSSMRSFVEHLADSGEVWVVSSSQAEIVRALARRYKISDARVVGIDFRCDAKGRYTDELIHPAPIDAAKVDAFKAAAKDVSEIAPHDSVSDRSAPSPTARGLTLMVGDSRYDLPMMRYAACAILIDHKRSTELTRAAFELGATCIPYSSVDD